MQRARHAGFRAIAFSAFWQPPLRALPPVERDALRRAARAAVAESITPIVDVAQFGSETPLTDAQQADFAAFAASVPRLVPQVEHVVVGNEPNTNLFWRPQFDASGGDAAARAYERLLARSYDAIKDVSPSVEVIGGGLAARGADRPNGKRPTHSPTAFIRDLGAAYRESGRSRPLMDAFSMHVYGETSVSRRRGRTSARRSGSPTTRSSRPCYARRSAARRRSSTASTASTRRSRRASSRRLLGRRGRHEASRRRVHAGALLRAGDRARRVPAARGDAPLLPRHRRAAARAVPDRHVLRGQDAEARARGGRADRRGRVRREDSLHALDGSREQRFVRP